VAPEIAIPRDLGELYSIPPANTASLYPTPLPIPPPAPNEALASCASPQMPHIADFRFQDFTFQDSLIRTCCPPSCLDKQPAGFSHRTFRVVGTHAKLTRSAGKRAFCRGGIRLEMGPVRVPTRLTCHANLTGCLRKSEGIRCSNPTNLGKRCQVPRCGGRGITGWRT